MALHSLGSELPLDALRVLALAQRHETPTQGGGPLVWHAWGEGRPLVLLHGGSGSWTHWLRNIETLAASGRQLVVPDLPCFGESAAPPGVQDADGAVDPLMAGLNRLLGEAPLDIVGFSFGGLVAGLLAGLHPDRVRHLVVVGPPALGLRSQRLPLAPWRHVEDPVARAQVHRANLAMLMLSDPASIDEDTIAIHAANVRRDRMRGRHLALTDVLARTLTTLTCRIDAIYGEHDALYRDMLPTVETILRNSPGFREFITLPGAGHWAPYERPVDFNAALLRLLDS